MFDRLWTDAKIATFAADQDEPYGLMDRGAVAVKNGRIAWAGAAADAPPARETISVGGALITPGLIDCHTHLVFGGNRAAEFEARLQGVSYEEIARAGGGIRSTVAATRKATEDELYESAASRLLALKREGVTCVEIKSGYGLDLENELKMLRVAKKLATEQVRITTTFLGAHTVPPEFEGRADDYIDYLCKEVLPAVHQAGLVDSVDGFCENVGFTTGQIRRLFETAHALGLPVKLHAEQLSDQKGARLAAQFGAQSVDHLEYLCETDVPALSQAGTVAVLLPGAFYFLKETKLPPISALRSARVPMALATDCNPGTSPITSPLLMLNFACTLFGLTPEESLRGLTCHAAKALGLEGECGTIEVGKYGDMAIWDVGHPSELCYWVGTQPLIARIFKGQAETV